LIESHSVSVSDCKIAQKFGYFLMDGLPVSANHHDRTSVLLFLPCDWRFLPKLGPLRLTGARAFFVNTAFNGSCHAISEEFDAKTRNFLRLYIVRRSNIASGQP